MFAAMRQWGSVGRLRRRRPPYLPIIARLVLAGLLGALAFGAPPAAADGLYRCTGSSGEAVFTSKTVGYKGCRRIGSVPGPRRAASARVASPGRNPFAGVVGSVDTTARALEALPLPPRLFAGVQASVHTTGTALPDATGRPPGAWRYAEDEDAVPSAAGKASAVAPGDRVLRGAVYRVTRADGSIEYTNIPPARARGREVTKLFTYIATCMACDLHSPIHWNSVRLNLDDYAAAIRQASTDFGVDEAFLRAIIHAESAFNPHALSIKGAQGLMQLMPGTARDMGVLDAFDAVQNIRGGARYLAQLLGTFHGDERLAAAAYNAGPGAVQRYNGVPPYAETQVYVGRVATLRQRYRQALHPPLASAIQ